MMIGYARTSTAEQVAGLEAQVRELDGHGIKRVYQERVSSTAKRERLEAAIDYCRDGDVLVVTKLDRLARSVTDLCAIMDRLAKQGATLRILAMDLDTATPTGKLMLNLMGSLAQFEREIMLERQREGIAKAKAEGKYKGRAPTAKAKAREVLAAFNEGMNKSQIAKAVGIGRASVHRIIAEASQS